MHDSEADFNFSFESLFSPLTNVKAICIIIFVGIAAFCNMLLNAFVWDDIIQIVNNESIDALNKIPSLFLTGQLGIFYRPVFYSILTILWSLFTTNVFFYHAFQLTIHITNCVLIYLLFKKFIDNRISLLLTLLFLIHPINVESVVYVSAISDPLFVFFGLLSLQLMMKKQDTIVTTVTASFLIILSLLTKEAGFLFFIIIILYRLLFNKKNWHLFIFIIAPIALYSYLRFGVAHTAYKGIDVVPIAQATFGERLLTMPKIIFYYISNLFIPNQLTIAQEWVVKSVSFTNFFLPLFIDMSFFILICAAGIYIYRHHRKFLSSYIFFLLWFLFSFSLYLQIIPLDMTVADRWFYLPLVGLLGMVGIILSNISLFKKNTKIIFVILISIIIIFSIRTMVRNINWYDGYTLYTHDAEINKDNYHLENNVAVELMRRGEFDRAKEHAERSIQLNPNWAASWATAGTINLYEKNYTKAIHYFREALKRDGGNYAAFYFLGQSLLMTKDYTSAKGWLEQALKSFPDNSPLLQLLAIAEYNLGNQTKALELAQKAMTSGDPQAQSIYQKIVDKQPLELQ